MGSGIFFKQLLRNPRQISAIAPSSRHLGRAMAEGLGPDSGRIVEFGPGTGSLTRAILERGVRPADLTLFELDADFVGALRRQFPGVTVHHAPADAAAGLIEPGVGTVISGLPLLSMPPEVSAPIVAAAFAILAPGAPLMQFTYGRGPSVPEPIVRELGLTYRQTAFVWRNLPPARVHAYRQLQHARH